ncbi:MAG TPA: YcgL domain-containing protein [Xanthomonadales bacterium]|nr:YcgL domain-containing protein [Xanthomonadales bacterium]
MRCSVFRSDKKAYRYIYLAEGKDFSELPAALRQQFGHPEQVMELDLAQVRRLAHADPEQVRRQLRQRGYYLQLPAEIGIEAEISRRMP